MPSEHQIGAAAPQQPPHAHVPWDSRSGARSLQRLATAAMSCAILRCDPLPVASPLAAARLQLEQVYVLLDALRRR